MACTHQQGAALPFQLQQALHVASKKVTNWSIMVRDALKVGCWEDEQLRGRARTAMQMPTLNYVLAHPTQEAAQTVVASAFSTSRRRSQAPCPCP